MMTMHISRRVLLGGAGATVALGPTGLARAAVAQVHDLPKIVLPPPIGSAERLQRLAKARALMQQHGIGAIIVESGPSLDYFTGVQWWRSERLTAAVIPVDREPIIVTPFFEKPSVTESLSIPAEVRTWNEDEEPLKLVADFLRERSVAAAPVLHSGSVAAATSGRAHRDCQSGRARLPNDQISSRDRADAGGKRHHGGVLALCRRADPGGNGAC
jgi:Xaa-Pro dipeptidase